MKKKIAFVGFDKLAEGVKHREKLASLLMAYPPLPDDVYFRNMAAFKEDLRGSQKLWRKISNPESCGIEHYAFAGPRLTDEAHEYAYVVLADFARASAIKKTAVGYKNSLKGKQNAPEIIIFTEKPEYYATPDPQNKKAYEDHRKIHDIAVIAPTARDASVYDNVLHYKAGPRPGPA